MNRRGVNGVRRNRKKYPLCLLLAAGVLFCLLFLASPKAQAQPEATEKYYTSIIVEAGDSLWSIAKTYTPAYGDIQAYMEELSRINSLGPGGSLRTGQSLIIVYYA